MATDNPKRCPTCGAVTPENSTAGNCPNCLLSLASLLTLADPDEDADDFENAASDGGPESFATKRFGDYELIAEIARGGMGVVYKARQISLDRLVVVKMLYGANFASQEQVQRFHYEARAGAKLDHPNIVHIYEIGEQEGQHFFTMMFFERGSLADHMERFQLSIKSARSKDRSSNRNQQCAIALMTAKIAHAVHYAHQRGVMHRDLKPSNILLDDKDEPHVGDFGLAKMAEDQTDLTQTGAVMGTPSYMSPEQAIGQVSEISVAVDVYGLGAILYHLLTGHPPFGAATPLEILRKVREDEPEPPHKTHPVDPDLETICLRCLEKNPEQRYGSALEVAEELERFSRREPIQARPVQPARRLVRWCQRHPRIAGLSFALATVFVTGLIGMIWQWQLAVSARNETQQLNEELGESLYKRDLRMVDLLMVKGETSDALIHLTRRLRLDPESGVAAFRAISILENYTFALPLIEPIQELPSIRKAIFSPDGTRIALICGNTKRVWSGGFNKMIRMREPLTSREYARLYDAQTGKPITGPLQHSDYIHDLSFSSDGKLLATASWDKTARIWDAVTGVLLQELKHDDLVWCARFSPDGSRVVTGSDNRTVQIWETATGNLLASTSEHGSYVRFAEFSPDGKRIVAASRNAAIWNANTGALLVHLSGHRSNVDDAHFSPDGSKVVTASWDGRARIFDAATGALLIEPVKHHGEINRVRFSADGQKFLTASADRTARVWSTHTGRPLTPPLEHKHYVVDADFSSDGRWVVTASKDFTAEVWDASTGNSITKSIQHGGIVWSAQFSPDGRRLATASQNGFARVWDIRPGQAQPESVPFDEDSLSKHTSRFGNRIVRTDRSRERAEVWIADVDTGKTVSGPIRHEKSIRSARFSPDGKSILTASEDGTARIWDAETLTEISPPMRHHAMVASARFSPNGKRVVTASKDKTACIWDVKTGKMVVGPLVHQDGVNDARFSADGRLVATSSGDRSARVWNATTGAPVTPPLYHKHWVTLAQFSPDGLRLLTGGYDRIVKLWDVRTGLPLTETLPHPGGPMGAIFSADGQSVVVGSNVPGDTKGIKYQLPVPPLPVPEWFLSLIESLVGQRISEEGLVQPIAVGELWAVKRTIQNSTAEDFYTHWAKWFFADRATRPRSAWSEQSN